MERKTNDIDLTELIHLSIDQYKEQAIETTGIDRNHFAATAHDRPYRPHLFIPSLYQNWYIEKFEITFLNIFLKTFCSGDGLPTASYLGHTSVTNILDLYIELGPLNVSIPVSVTELCPWDEATMDQIWPRVDQWDQIKSCRPSSLLSNVW